MGDIDLNPFRRRLLKHGEPAQARVLEVEVPSNQSPGAFLTHKYLLEIQPSGAPRFQAKVKDAFNVFWAPKRGDMLNVKFNAKSHKAAFDLEGDPRYDASMQKHTGPWTPGESPPPSVFGTPPAGASTGPPAGATGAERLQELAELRDGGLITPSEYEAQRLRILHSL